MCEISKSYGVEDPSSKKAVVTQMVVYLSIPILSIYACRESKSFRF